MVNDYNFAGKTVIITGGTYGIGGACTESFCEVGANVVMCARNIEKGEALQRQMRDLYGEQSCLFVPCDVSVEEQIVHVIEKTVATYGRIDVLVNNAGSHPPAEEIDDVSSEMFNDLVTLNLTSMFLFCKYALPYLRQVGGNIINMTSFAGINGQRLACRYSTVKAGILGLTKALAIDEASKGVRVNCVAPGVMLTPLTMSSGSKNPKLSSSWCHMNRRGSSKEVADVCVMLASERSSFITGAEIPVTGGAELGYGIKQY